MKLYLIQHGEAKSELEDPERSLTSKGEEEVNRVAKAATGCCGLGSDHGNNLIL